MQPLPKNHPSLRKVKNSHRLIISLTALAIAVVTVLVAPVHALAATYAHTLTEPIEIRPAKNQGEVFFQNTSTFHYDGGQIWLSELADATGQTFVDDALNIQVVRPDQTMKSFSNTYQSSCLTFHPKDPQEITHLFQQGDNQVTLKLQDVCGKNVSSSSLHLVNTNAPTKAPEPFLRIPWDYQKHGLTFTDAALSMTSYFDHTYPLLSASWAVEEPEESSSQVTTYKGHDRTDIFYSTHDGYDYARKAKALIDEPVLAAASGCASYHYNRATGHAVYIDHQNGYQTRYYHMQEDGLITQDSDSCVQVAQGQEIGKIGYSGNVIPSGAGGAHIHFMVVEDKDQDGDFNNNIPDGLVDPFGWQGSSQDPWEEFSFTMLGQDLTGNKSHYLWQETIPSATAQLSASKFTDVTADRFHVRMPAIIHSLPVELSLNPVPSTTIIADREPIGTVAQVTARDTHGNYITTFNRPATVEIEFDPQSLFNLDPATLQIFSSPDSKLWKSELTTIDWVNHIAKISVTHLTDFVLTGKTLDTTAPISEVLINGEPLSEAAIYEDQAVLTFASQDDQDGVGVENTWYQVNDSSWQDFAQEIEINLAGDYIVQFYAEDQAGNTEESHQVEFTIEGTSDDNQSGEEATDEDESSSPEEENSDEEDESPDDQEESSPSETGEEDESSSPDEDNSDEEEESPPSEQEENDNSSQPADESTETVTAQIQVDFKQNYFILNCTRVEDCSHTVSSPNEKSNLSTHKFSAQGVTLIEISLDEKTNPDKSSPAIKSIKYGQSTKILDTKTNYQAKKNGEIKRFSFSAKLKTDNLTCSQ